MVTSRKSGVRSLAFLLAACAGLAAVTVSAQADDRQNQDRQSVRQRETTHTKQRVVTQRAPEPGGGIERVISERLTRQDGSRRDAGSRGANAQNTDAFRPGEPARREVVRAESSVQFGAPPVKGQPRTDAKVEFHRDHKDRRDHKDLNSDAIRHRDGRWNDDGRDGRWHDDDRRYDDRHDDRYDHDRRDRWDDRHHDRDWDRHDRGWDRRHDWGRDRDCDRPIVIIPPPRRVCPPPVVVCPPPRRDWCPPRYDDCDRGGRWDRGWHGSRGGLRIEIGIPFNKDHHDRRK
ncbi:MAG: hypothetical protein SFZ23_08170 [Planctomycetota bacterium]|nr:hypothetical protein [Planctomycetota bacterium]